MVAGLNEHCENLICIHVKTNSNIVLCFVIVGSFCCCWFLPYCCLCFLICFQCCFHHMIPINCAFKTLKISSGQEDCQGSLNLLMFFIVFLNIDTLRTHCTCWKVTCMNTSRNMFSFLQFWEFYCTFSIFNLQRCRKSQNYCQF